MNNLRNFLYNFITQNERLFLYIFLSIIGFIILIPVFTYVYFASDIKNKESIMNRSNTGLTLLDRDGTPFFTFNQPKEIQYINLSDIPKSMQDAVIASEDKNFYTNPGFSIRGIIRALLTDVMAGRIVEGGSTITQELVKNALLNSQRNILRKYQELVLAYELNRRYSKQDILEMYLNSVYFGEGAFGVENAAEAYFGIHAKDLTLAQSALLVGLLPAPSSLSPLSNNPQLAARRQRLVLTQMVTDNLITTTQEQQALNETLTYHPVKQQLNTLAPHFALYVKDLLIKVYGEENVLRSGYKVTTTLNATWQAYAEKTVQNQVGRLAADDASNGAAVAINPKTGEIEVMVGSEDWNNEKFGKTNMVTTPRQPGSSFKPFVYSAAFEQHIMTPSTILQDVPTTFPGNYKPHDYDGKYRGPVTVRRALANSLNIPAVEVMEQVGVPNALSIAQRLGITTLKDPTQYGLSLVLGAGEVKLLEMTDAYAVFADNGSYNAPTAILEIQDKNNHVIDSFTPNPKNVLGDDISFLISSILSDNTTRAEEFGNALTISRPAAVKTGTTEDFRDALTIGYTPSLVVGVWVGNNDNTPMDNVAGSLGAAPIWRAMMEQFLLGTPIETFKPPASITSEPVCPYKGSSDQKTATSSAYIEYYVQGTAPSEPCVSPTPSVSPTPESSSTPTPTNSPAPTNVPTDTPLPTDSPTPTPIEVTTPPLPTLFH